MLRAWIIPATLIATIGLASAPARADHQDLVVHASPATSWQAGHLYRLSRRLQRALRQVDRMQAWAQRRCGAECGALQNRLQRLEGELEAMQRDLGVASYDPRDRDHDGDVDWNDSRYGGGTYDGGAYQGGWTGAGGRVTTMTPTAFATFLASVHRTTFETQKLALIRYQAGVSWFTAAQARRLLAQMSFDTYRLQALQALAPRIVDPQNAVAVTGAFSYDSYRRRALSIMRRTASATPTRYGNRPLQ